MTEQALPSSAGQRGRGSALLVYALYLLSIPSAGVFALMGVIVALIARGDADPLAKGHLNHQARIWWTAFWWSIWIGLIGLIGWLLTLVLIGYVFLWIAGAIGFLVAAWFTIKSLLGLLKLIDGRPA